MEILLNGNTRQLADDATAADLIDALGLGGRRYAMEVNGELLPKSAHAGHVFKPGDRVEIVHAVGGG